MASITLYLDRRYKRDDGVFPVKIKVSFKGNKGFLIPTSARITSDQWARREVVRHPARERLNAYLRDRQNAVTNAIHDLEMSSRIGDISLPAIKKRVESVLTGGDSYSFRDHFKKMIGSMVKQSTREIYRQTLHKVEVFDKRELVFSDITFAWLKDFERFMQDHDRRNSLVSKPFKAAWNKQYLINLLSF